MNSLSGIIEDLNKSDLVTDKVIKEVINIIGQDKWNELIDNDDSHTCTTMGEVLITLRELQHIENSAKEGWYIAYDDDSDKRYYYSGCKMGSGFVNSIYSAKIYKSKDNALKTILEKIRMKNTSEWKKAFLVHARVMFD